MKKNWHLTKISILSSALVMANHLALEAGVLRPITPPSSSTTTPAGTNPGTGTTPGLPNAQARLVRTAQALQAVQTMQAAARSLAITGPNNLGFDPKRPGTRLPDVPNGLVAGGLVDIPSLWSGASSPQQAVVGNQTKVTVVQNAPQAILNWSSFNIGKQTTLNFDQSLGGADQSKWIAFNKVNDPSGIPSQILGMIQAPGQVYVINANGIIFGGSAQINVNTLVASALPINDNLINRGLLNNPDAQFLFSSLSLPAGANGTPAFTPPSPATPDGQPGDVEVQPGASISTPTTADHVGGRVFLIGTNVKNAGMISTPDGQTILAAGLQVGLTAHPTIDPSLRGLDAYVGAVVDPNSTVTPPSAGTVSNDGLIDVPRGNVTLAGAAVNQNGFIDSTTSVSLNGRIDLLADYNAIGGINLQRLPAFFPRNTGVVTLGPNSVTEVLPELFSADTVVGATLALPSQINLEGLAMYLAPNSSILAPNAKVALNAGIWNLAYSVSGSVDTFVNANGFGQIYLDLGASIDVGGSSDVAVPVSENTVAVQLTAAALANSPLLRNGPLRGQTIYVDIGNRGTYNGLAWVGTPLADALGYANLIQRSVGELTTAGGIVTMAAGESVVMQPGSMINVLGGWVNYQGGEVPVTRLISAGHAYLAAQATPDRVYESAISSLEFQPGYYQGANGGSISIGSPVMALDGSLVGNTVSGPRQQQQPPSPSSLSLGFGAPNINISFQASSNLTPADSFALDNAGNPLPLRADRGAEVILSPNLVGQSGFGSFSVDNGDGTISVPAQIELKSVVGGSINLSAANMDIEGSVVAPGGSLLFKVYDFSPSAIGTLQATPAPDPARGHFILGPTGSLNAEGTIALSYSTDLAPVRLDGGTISIKTYSADLAQGSIIDASGGVATSATGKRTYGKGGSIAINAGQDPNIASILGGQLVLDTALRAFSGSKGGSLSLLAPSIQIGGDTVNPDTLLISPDFFRSGGFSSYTLKGIGGLAIAPNTVVAPEVQNLLAVVNADGAATLIPFLPPEGLRTPVSLTLGASGVRDNYMADPLVVRGDLVMGEGAVIRTDPQGTVSLSGDTVAVRGSIFAPGGAITISGGSSSVFGSQPQQALPTVNLGPRSVLSASGATVLTPNSHNYRIGSVLPGGTITVKGNIVAESGSILDVSGASDVLNVAPGYLGPAEKSTSGLALVPIRIESDGGSVFLAGGQELMSEATLRGFAGGPTANGGSLMVSSGRFYPPSTISSPFDITLALSQQDLALSSSFYPAGETAIGHPVFDSNGQPIPGFGHFSADSFQAGGFDALTLGGTVQFSGPVTISANRFIKLADTGLIFADASIHLMAPYITLGTAFQAPQQAAQLVSPFFPFTIAPTYGPGNLTVEASSLIDIGVLSLQNIGQATIRANGGDIRGGGILEIAGNMTLRAGQIYPPTAMSFTIAAFDYNMHLGSVTIEVSGNRQLPFSAGGTLSVYASTINQDGVLRAPLGTIRLGWDGTGTGPLDLISGTTFPATKELTLGNSSVTSVSAIDPITGQVFVIPYGIEVNGSSWIDPTGVDITSGGVPAKSIQLSAASVLVNPNAQIDIRGGGDLYAYQWVSGNGGSQDILASSSSFAILPSYLANYAPFAPYNPNALNTYGAKVFVSDPGYVNNGLSVGDQIYLHASSGLAAGTYTLLPARYALLPGAFLVTPMTGIPNGTTTALPDGSSVVSGYRDNDLNSSRVGQPLTAQFAVAPATVVRSRAEYKDFLANGTFAQAAAFRGVVPPRLPIDAGQLVFSATQTMSLNGRVAAETEIGGQAGFVDISSPQAILIAGSSAPSQPGVLVLDAAELSSFKASLLIGGIHQTDATGTRVTVQTGNVTVDNSGTPLTGPDVILVANHQLTLAPGADIETAGALSGAAETILLGNLTLGSGNGVLVRVSADPVATSSRSGVNPLTLPQPVLTIGAGAQLTGPSVTIDSTGATTIDPGALFHGTSISIASGRMSLALTDPGSLPADAGLILSGAALQSLQTGAQALSLLSYSSIDTYGTGKIGRNTFANLALHAAEIRGYNQGAGTVQFVAQNILLDNRANGTAPGPVTGGSGTLAVDAAVITLGANPYRIDQFAQLELNATRGLLFQGSGGLTTPRNLTITTPLIAGATAAQQTIRADGDLSVDAPTSAASSPTLSPGLSARLSLIGDSITDNSIILLPSGVLQLEAIGGDVVIGSAGEIDVGGVAKTFFDQVRHTDGGQVSLISDLGSVILAAGSTVNVSAPAQGGNAGRVAIRAPSGHCTLNGIVLGNGGVNGQAGTFQLDVGTLPAPSLAGLNAALNLNGFTQTRSIRVGSGDVLLDGLATAHRFALSTDNGTISVTGTIDASGATGGTIDLAASGSVLLEQNSHLSVAGQNFDNAGKGGSVSLAAGQEINGNIDGSAVVDIQAGATIDLSVAAKTPSSAAAGRFTGTLHLRAPQTPDSLDLQINPVNGTILHPSKIVIEGYALFNLNNAGTITTTVKNNVFANGTTFAGNSVAIMNRLLANNGTLASVMVIRPGADILNPSGDLTLDTTWDLSTFRFGPQGQPGVLTLRAKENLNFNYNASLQRFASLSDGFTSASYSAPLLPAGSESWSYRLVAGADLGAAAALQVQPLNLLNANTGSLLLGKNAQAIDPFPVSNQPAQAPSIIPKYYQTVRTGTGDIDISAGRDIQLLSPLATIYTAGTQASALPNFDLPILDYPSGTVLGTAQYSTPYPAQYSFGGGNVTLSAQNDIARYQVSPSGTLSPDSSKELPSNWLYRRGHIDSTAVPVQFDITHNGGEVASTSWWIDFSNFFEGIGTLGGGNVTLTAGRDVSNVDAVIPTNARMPKGIPQASGLVELGGGDLQVLAGRDIDGGVYYVERGQGTLRAGNTLHSNPTRAALDQTTIISYSIKNTVPDPTTWLPTTLFLGKGSFDITAQGDVLLGPVANPFLLPQGINNSFFEKTYFTTYAPSDAVNVSSLTGTITLKDSANSSSGISAGSLASWYQSVFLFTQNPKSFASKSQPWLRLAETQTALTAFTAGYTLMPATLRVTAFSGDLNIVGGLTLSPSPIGTLELMAVGSINGLQPNALDSVTRKYRWGTSRINLSDADPNRLPGITSPLSLAKVTSDQEQTAWSNPGLSVINGMVASINALLNESGSRQGSYGVLQTQLALHGPGPHPGPLHAYDLDPVRLYAENGDVSGLTLFSGKSTRVVAGQNITDIALYIQNVADNDVSVVSAGRDIVAYDPNSPLRARAQIGNNTFLVTQFGRPVAGDIQINGPGTLEVLAGRNLDLGVGPNNSDGTGVGITSIGNARNPNLPFAGADVIAAAGIGRSAGLDQSALNFQGFITEFLDPTTGNGYAPRYLPQVADLLGLYAGSDLSPIWNGFEQLPTEKQDRVALDIFYRVLRDAGRDHNDATSPGFGNYNAGFAAIAALFPETTSWQGAINLTSREIKTASGGDISLFAPGGQLLVGYDLSGNQPVDQGVLTEAGGNISIFTRNSAIVGTSRIFTLRGGNIIMWSSAGDIAAGASSKTVQSAPPTRVLVDPQFGSVQTDLAGLATGGGIGVLTSVAGVLPGDVDLIAPVGAIDAGDAGIRVSGNINLAAAQVLNVGNIQAQGTSAGVPAPAVSFSASGLQAANASAAATTTGTGDVTGQARETSVAQEKLPSLISVEVLGYGGGDGSDPSGEEENDRKYRKGQAMMDGVTQTSLLSMR
jgi:filamentous hemagglutinin family protein